MGVWYLYWREFQIKYFILYKRNIIRFSKRTVKNLIDSTTHVLDFEGRKFLNIGIVACTEYDRGVGGYDGENFGIVIRLPSSKRHVDIRYELLNRIFSVVDDILSIVPELYPSSSLLAPLQKHCTNSVNWITHIVDHVLNKHNKINLLNRLNVWFPSNSHHLYKVWFSTSG